MSEGDVHSLIYKLKPKSPFDKSYASSLLLTWRRREQMPMKRISGSLSEEAALNEAAGSVASCEAQTLCRLHSLITQKPLLSAKCQPPGTVHTGAPFPYILHISNETTLPEEFEISVTEAPGCLFGGDRSNQVIIAPNEHKRIRWECVAHASGNMRLPRITITSPRLKVFVEMDGIEIFVEPPLLAT